MTQEHRAKRDAADVELTAKMLSIPADVDADFTMSDAREVSALLCVAAAYYLARGVYTPAFVLSAFRAIWRHTRRSTGVLSYSRVGFAADAIGPGKRDN